MENVESLFLFENKNDTIYFSYTNLEVIDMKKRIMGLLLAVMLLCSLALPAYADSAAPMVTIMFTHDLHSHLLPADNEKGESYGGYARLKTAIDDVKSRQPDAILVDGGDFSMGSLFQTVYATDAAELRMMGALGYVSSLGTIGQSAQTSHNMCWLVAGLYMFSAVLQFIGIALIYNLDKKTLAQMNADLAARKAK